MDDGVRGEREEGKDAIALNEPRTIRLLEGQVEQGQGGRVRDLRDRQQRGGGDKGKG